MCLVVCKLTPLSPYVGNSGRQIEIYVLRGYFRPGPELSSANFPASEFFGEGFFVTVAEGVQVGVEFGGVVKVFQVG